MTTRSSCALLALLLLTLGAPARADELVDTLAQFDEVLGAASHALTQPTRIELLASDGERTVLHWQQGRYREELHWLGFSEMFGCDSRRCWYGATLRLPYALHDDAPPQITLELCRALAFLQPEWRGYVGTAHARSAGRPWAAPTKDATGDGAGPTTLFFTPPNMPQAQLTLSPDSLLILIGNAPTLSASTGSTETVLLDPVQFGDIPYFAHSETIWLDGKGELLRSKPSTVVNVERVAALAHSEFEITASPAVPAPALPRVPYTIDFELQRGSVIFPVTAADGTELRLELDTGAGLGMLRREVAAELGLTPVGDEVVRGHGGMAAVQYARVEGMRLGAAEIPAWPASVFTGDNTLDTRLGQAGIDGLLGSFLLQSYVVRVDYPKRQLTLWPRDSFDAAQLDRDKFTALLHRERLPWAEVVVDGVIHGGAFFNTGASYPFALSQWACDQAGIQYPLDSMDRAVSVGGSALFGIVRPGEVRLIGLLGRADTPVGQIVGADKSVDPTDIILRSPPTALELLSPGEQQEQMRIASFGSSFLRDYAITFDLLRERVYLESRP